MITPKDGNNNISENKNNLDSLLRYISMGDFSKVQEIIKKQILIDQGNYNFEVNKSLEDLESNMKRLLLAYEDIVNSLYKVNLLLSNIKGKNYFIEGFNEVKFDLSNENNQQIQGNLNTLSNLLKNFGKLNLIGEISNTLNCSVNVMTNTSIEDCPFGINNSSQKDNEQETEVEDTKEGIKAQVEVSETEKEENEVAKSFDIGSSFKSFGDNEQETEVEDIKEEMKAQAEVSETEKEENEVAKSFDIGSSFKNFGDNEQETEVEDTKEENKSQVEVSETEKEENEEAKSFDIGSSFKNFGDNEQETEIEDTKEENKAQVEVSETGEEEKEEVNTFDIGSSFKNFGDIDKVENVKNIEEFQDQDEFVETEEVEEESYSSKFKRILKNNNLENTLNQNEDNKYLTENKKNVFEVFESLADYSFEDEEDNNNAHSSGIKANATEEEILPKFTLLV